MLTQTSTISHGNMSLRFGEAQTVIQNRKNFLTKNNIAWDKHICMRCSHGEQIRVVDAETSTDPQRMVNAEVLITQETGLALALLTADCLPTTFFDPTTQTLALAHFSRQTIANELPRKTLDYLVHTFAISPTNMEIIIGPHIHKTSYSFPAPLPSVSEVIQPYTNTDNGYTYIDLAAAHNAQLTATGVPQENITLSAVDTAASSQHFSHYETTKKSGLAGRVMTISMM